MPLRLIAGPANAGKVERLLDRYLATLDREPVLIVPNRSDVDRVERELLAGSGALMAGEIENSIESAIGVTLPPASLMLARTIGQIATLIAEHMSGTPEINSSTTPVLPAKPEATDEVDLKALSDDAIDRLLGDATPHDPTELMQETRV